MIFVLGLCAGFMGALVCALIFSDIPPVTWDAGWVQAIGSVAAILIAVAVAWFEHRRARHERLEDRRTVQREREVRGRALAALWTVDMAGLDDSVTRLASAIANEEAAENENRAEWDAYTEARRHHDSLDVESSDPAPQPPPVFESPTLAASKTFEPPQIPANLADQAWALGDDLGQRVTRVLSLAQGLKTILATADNPSTDEGVRTAVQALQALLDPLTKDLLNVARTCRMTPDDTITPPHAGDKTVDS